MTDPLSVAASVAGLISLGIQVTQSLVDFYKAYENRDSELVHTIERLDSLLDIFQCLRKILSDRHFQAEERSLVESIETSIISREEFILELQDECQKFSKTPSQGIRAAVRVVGRRVTYPFRQSTLQKLDEDIGEIQANLSSALDVLQLKDNERIEDDITEIKVLLDLVRTSQISSNLRDWLNAPDATIDHNASCAKKHPGTGTWLVKSPQFSRWLTEENSIMWLNGFAGSGKSVLCSTAIQFALRHRRSDPNVGIAFFYFTFNDESKQDISAMLRSLLLQLSSQLRDGHADLTRLHESYKAGTPPSPVLIEHLHRLIQRFHQVYIMLDALDESPRNGPREYVLDTLESMRNWGVQGLHLFVTSRDEPDIRDSLDISATQQITMQNAGIDKNITDFISSQFDTDRKLRKWLPYREKIEKTLAERAKGMFRWVECQFKALQSCPCSEDHLDRLLGSLPQSLDETYERMLCNIDHSLVEDARRILTLVCFASRPLTVREIIDGVAVEINNSTGLNRKRRLQDSNDIREICVGFIDIGLGTDYTTETYHEEELTPTVRIAHFSVQEYLESERIRHQKAAMFSLTSVTAHAEIAQICLTYLLEHGLSSSNLDQNLLEEFPLAKFAAMYWYHHYQTTAKHDPGLEDSILKLFQRQDSFATWVKLHDMDRSWDTSINFRRTLDDIPAPVYYVSLLGLDQALHDLVNNEQLESTKIPALSPTSRSSVSKNINTQGGRYGNALQAAAGGYDQVVTILLDKGANVNAQGGHYGNALQAASFGGYIRVVQMLLGNGADVNAEGGCYGSALTAASAGGNEKLVEMLLSKGANVTAKDSSGRAGLHWAAANGHETVVRLLVEQSGVEVDMMDTYEHTPATLAVIGGSKGSGVRAGNYLDKYIRAVDHLFNAGADINRRDRDGSTVLHHAIQTGYEEMQKLLIDLHADLFVRNNAGESPAQLAWAKKRLDWSQYIVDRETSETIEPGSNADIAVLSRKTSYGHGPQRIFCKTVDLRKPRSRTEKEKMKRIQKYLVREHDLLQRLEHPHIVSYLGYDETHGEEKTGHDTKYTNLFMEYCNDGNLAHYCTLENTIGADEYDSSGDSSGSDYLPDHATLEENEGWSFMFHMALALTYCHHGLSIDSNGGFCFKKDWVSILHRDIKPTNIVLNLNQDGTRVSKLCDLGVAKAFGDKSGTKFIGTQQFWPPEIKGGGYWTVKADIYSLGATFDKLDITSPSQDFKKLVARCMSGLPEDRPSSFGLLEHIWQYLSHDNKRYYQPLRRLLESESGGFLLGALMGVASQLDSERPFDHRISKNRRRAILNRMKLLCEDGAGQIFCVHGQSLHIAVLLGDKYKVQQLLEAGKDVREKWENSGWAALHLAAQTNYSDIARILCDHGANPEDEDTFKHSANYYASQNGLELEKLLSK